MGRSPRRRRGLLRLSGALFGVFDHEVDRVFNALVGVDELDFTPDKLDPERADEDPEKFINERLCHLVNACKVECDFFFGIKFRLHFLPDDFPGTARTDKVETTCFVLYVNNDAHGTSPFGDGIIPNV